ncbi:forespore regulator of the sigma-K checkpoint [Gracilibacillus boraciitolerans JCM 21714]|uniref:Forespore regulator of the sigma-K checkpoint n=1 Tax=Gracilibacillus boraciitolerans JCM 21714 TaxID=1298598 RepID=W4VIE0_9BACI|nr:BofC C-terminal domain-containing protein [Gracilibacillus boraciitolerans]GAE92588.1 forespore regulator of the sigma-K checkpoint [Gracilibacillus boraciitolerans JCM 21714]
MLLNGVVVLIIGVIGIQSLINSEETKSSEEDVMVIAQDLLTIEVTLEKHYIDGKIEKKHVEETITSMQDFWSQYQDWKVMEQKEGYMRFQKQVDDISPYLKANGYFGIKNGKLTIFEGVPLQEEAIQSFYQIETEELEAHLYEQLKEGIKINSKQDYIEVLETFKAYQNVEAVNS